MITRDEFTITNVKQLRSGRSIAAEYKGTRMMNIYAPSGTANRQEREHFYTSDLTYLLQGSPSNMFVGGDFNCILNKSDTTGHFNYSKALDGLVRELCLQDMSQADPSRKSFHTLFSNRCVKDRSNIHNEIAECQQSRCRRWGQHSWTI